MAQYEKTHVNDLPLSFMSTSGTYLVNHPWSHAYVISSEVQSPLHMRPELIRSVTCTLLLRGI